jgi:RNA polymerase sigma-70 factor, ECF subfamily
MMKNMLEDVDTSGEALLLRQAADGSADAFAQLVCLHEFAVRWCLTCYVHDPPTVDDLAQEVFLCAYQQLTARRSIENLRFWLIGVARNRAREYLRADARRRAREQGPLAIQLARWRLERLENESAFSEEPERTFAALQECLGRLAAESRRVIEEHYFESQTLERIAKRLGRSGGAVRTMLFRIRNVLLKCIRQKLAKQP